MNELAYKDIISLIDHKTKEGIVAFKWVNIAKESLVFQKKNAIWHDTGLFQSMSHIQHHHISI